MSTSGLDWQMRDWPFGFGLNQQTDKRSRPAPALDIAKDLQVDEQGGTQTRYPYAAALSSIFGGGSLSTCRRVFSAGDELLVFTKDTLYTWSARDTKFHSRGTYLAVKTAEETAFGTNGDQITADRAELSDTIVYAWADGAGVYAAARDKTTGAVICPPTLVDSDATRPRLVALTTKILLFMSVNAGNENLVVLSIDPAAVATGLAASATVIIGDPDFNLYYDVVRVAGSDSAIGVARLDPTTSYEIFKISNAAAVTSSVTKARTCDGPIAISCDPSGATAQVVRANGANIQGDRITVSSLADAATGQAVGTAAATVNQIAACHRSVQDSGAYRCYAFWSAGEAVSGAGLVKYNYVDTGGTIGTQANFVVLGGVASRAFDYDGRIYVHVVFPFESGAAGMGEPLGIRAALQNTYFLYRDDALLCAKSVTARAGGFSAATGHLPGVALTSGTTGYSWCGGVRRVVPLGGSDHSGYAARAPQDITITFDSDEARRCVKLGETVYITGGEILQYDGSGLFEVQFHIYPWAFISIAHNVGNVANGTYALKSTYRWPNAKGELERSTTATGELLTVSAGPDTILFQVFPLHHTHKTGARRTPNIEIWRTATAPTNDSPYYRVTGNDPNVLAPTTNSWIPNDHTVTSITPGDDDFADATLIEKETNPENGGFLESLAPPPAGLIAASESRIFLADIAGEPDRVWYSKLRQNGEVAAFHDTLVVDVPRRGGRITAIAAREDALIVWRETATYVFPGVGYDNLGQGQNYGPVAIVSEDIGAVSAESVARTDKGYIFDSAKGWQILRGLDITYIGGPVADYDAETVKAITVIESQHQIRILTASRMLVLDTDAGQWFEWTIADGLDACMWNGAHVYLTATGPRVQGTAYTSLTFGQDAETAWIKLSEVLQGAAAVRKILLLGEERSACYVRVRVAYNYDETYVDDRATSISGPAGEPLQIKHAPRRPRCQAIKVRITANALSSILTSTMSTPVALIGGGTWNEAVFESIAPRTLSIGLVLGSEANIEVRDNERWTGDSWESAPNNVGVKVTGNNTTAQVTTLEVENAIGTDSQLILNCSTNQSPDDPFDFTGPQLDDYAETDPAVEAFPTGEAFKLTGLSLEIGTEGHLFATLRPARQQ